MLEPVCAHMPMPCSKLVRQGALSIFDRPRHCITILPGHVKCVIVSNADNIKTYDCVHRVHCVCNVNIAHNINVHTVYILHITSIASFTNNFRTGSCSESTSQGYQNIHNTYMCAKYVQISLEISGFWNWNRCGSQTDTVPLHTSTNIAHGQKHLQKDIIASPTGPQVSLLTWGWAAWLFTDIHV